MLLNIALVVGFVALLLSAILVTRPLARVRHGVTRRYPGDIRDFFLSLVFGLATATIWLPVSEGMKGTTVAMLLTVSLLGVVLNSSRATDVLLHPNDDNEPADEPDLDTSHETAEIPAVSDELYADEDDLDDQPLTVPTAPANHERTPSA